MTIHIEELDYLIWATQRLSVEQIIRRFNVKARRAATLMIGAIIFREVMNQFGDDSMDVSEFGVREGAILELADGSLSGSPL